jgi:hypothetical protein
MDLSKIKSVVLNQLINTNGLYSLKLQNHIYGCFLLMEDIAQRAVTVTGTVLATPKISFNFDKQFGEIGIRYGFAMDTKLVLYTYAPEYKDTWLQYFKDIATGQTIEEVDKIEDCLIRVIQEVVKGEDGFFLAAIETGSLPLEWIDKVLTLLNGGTVVTATVSTTEGAVVTEAVVEKEEPVEKTAVSQAATEKPIHGRRALAKTRRAGVPVVTAPKKNLAKTRRHAK